MSVSSSEASTENMIIPMHPALPPSGRTSRLRPTLTFSRYQLSCVRKGRRSSVLR